MGLVFNVLGTRSKRMLFGAVMPKKSHVFLGFTNPTGDLGQVFMLRAEAGRKAQLPLESSQRAPDVGTPCRTGLPKSRSARLKSHLESAGSSPARDKRGMLASRKRGLKAKVSTEERFFVSSGTTSPWVTEWLVN
ncbi:hypothetical protein SLE2022_405160 [Rubroshorea leprosula]